MINFDNYTRESNAKHDLNLPYILDYPYRILVIGTSGKNKTNVSFNLKNHQPDIHKIYLYIKRPYRKLNIHFFNKHGNVGLNYYNDHKAFIEHSNDMQDVCKNIDEYSLDKRQKTVCNLEF